MSKFMAALLSYFPDGLGMTKASDYVEQMAADPAMAAAFREQIEPKLLGMIAAELGAEFDPASARLPRIWPLASEKPLTVSSAMPTV